MEELTVDDPKEDVRLHVTTMHQLVQRLKIAARCLPSEQVNCSEVLLEIAQDMTRALIPLSIAANKVGVIIAEEN